MPGRAEYADVPPVNLGDMLHDAQADTDAGGFAAQLRAEPMEAVEDALVFVHRNARPLIGDGELKPPAGVRE